MINAVVEEIRNAGYVADVTTVNKNGVMKQGIIMGEGKVRPTIYIDGIKGDAYEVATEVIRTYEELDESETTRFENVGEIIMDWDKVKGMIVPGLMKAKDNKLVTKKFLDLNVYYRIMISADAVVKVTTQILEKWGIDKKELHDTAIGNAKGTYGATDMMAMLMGLGVDLEKEDFSSLNDSPMFVITNDSKVNGTSALLDNGIFKAVAESLDDDLYIIPSSIHELIVVPANGSMSVDELTEMICNVNDTTVSPEEQLSNHPYLFSREKGKVGIA